MKKLFNIKRILGLAAILVCGLTVSLSLTSCDNDVINSIFDDGVESWDDYVSIKITRCERVGHNLIIDYEMKNKKDRELIVNVSCTKNPIVDNLGNAYYNEFAFASDSYRSYNNVNIAAKNTVIGHIKVKDFDDTNKAKKINLKMYVKINGVDIDNEHSIFSQDGIKITDNRVLKDGVQTNDNNLAYTLQSCYYNSEGNVVLKFSVKNNTGYGLEYFTLSDNKAYDDLGNAYNTYVENYSYSRWNINEGGSINVTCTVENVNKNAKNITVWLYNSISNYIPTDNVVRFITIPIQK